MCVSGCMNVCVLCFLFLLLLYRSWSHALSVSLLAPHVLLWTEAPLTTERCLHQVKLFEVCRYLTAPWAEGERLFRPKRAAEIVHRIEHYQQIRRRWRWWKRFRELWEVFAQFGAAYCPPAVGSTHNCCSLSNRHKKWSALRGTLIYSEEVDLLVRW